MPVRLTRQSKFQSTLPARGATQHHGHAAHQHGISIHAPRTGSDGHCDFGHDDTSSFQSTLPARGATPIKTWSCVARLFQSTLPARGATGSIQHILHRAEISIHAPRTGSDQSERRSRKFTANFNPRSPHGERHKPGGGAATTRIFQSTLPARGATRWFLHHFREVTISIHAPRTGSDPATFSGTGTGSHFNPRSPHGERLIRRLLLICNVNISIHAPRTGSDDAWLEKRDWSDISIHAPRTGSDVRVRACPRRPRHFNPRSPHGERLCDDINASFEMDISIHAPRTGSDQEGRNCAV